MRKLILLTLLTLALNHAYSWGFFGHRKINHQAVFLLPPGMIVFYKQHIGFISEHAVDPDKRRYILPEEGPRHYIDIDRYGTYPYDSLPRRWDSALARYSQDTLNAHGIVPWWVQLMKVRLTNAFKEKDGAKIIKLSAEIGHYIADAHVPLHTSSNHDGQHTDQKGIHGFWESRVPELLADKEWNFFIGKAEYIRNTQDFIWKRVLESAAAADTVLQYEKQLSQSFSPDQRYAFEPRNGVVVRQYASTYARAYDKGLNGMIERRMRQSIYAIASFWYTAWVDAGQPDLTTLTNISFSSDDQAEFEALNRDWRNSTIKPRPHE